MDIKKSLELFYEFLDKPLYLWSRFALVIAVIPLIVSFSMPLWNIFMIAPQYPEGLTLDIYAHRIAGGNDDQHIQEINTLNHYIGMAPIDRARLNDLDWIPFAIGVLVILTLRCAAIGNVRALIDLVVFTVYFSLFSLARFVYMLYQMGHNLDSRAPVTIEPFMPVVIGTKQVANFTVSSYPRGASVALGIYVAIILVLMTWHLVRGRIESLRRQRA